MPLNRPLKHTRKEDIQLVDPGDFQQLFQRYHLALYRFIYGLHGGPREDVEDLTTTTFLRAWKARRRFRGDERAALSWLLKIARNLVIDTHRRNKNREIILDGNSISHPSPIASPEEQIIQNEQTRILWDLLNKLPIQHKEILVLRYILGWRVKDIATHLQMSENNVSATIRRKLKKLQNEWPH